MRYRDHLTLFGLILSTFSLVGCGRPARHVVAQATSPDGTLVAIVKQEEPTPLVSMDSLIFIKPVSRDLDENSDLVFRGGDMNGRRYGPLNIRWQDNDHLWIGYCTGRTAIYRNTWLDGHSATPKELRISLDKEAEGHWPVGGPPKGSAGPPPCP